MQLFGLSALSSITTLISGSVTDEFKKLIQPRALVAAAVFLVLNLALVFLPLVEARVAFAVALAGIPPIWQAALLTLALPILGYLFSSLRVVFLNVVNGRVLRDSWLGALLLRWQHASFDRLAGTVRSASESEVARAASSLAPKFPNANEEQLKSKARSYLEGKAAHAATRLALDFPHKRDAIVPTALGNVLLSTSSYTLNQYGARLEALYPIISSQFQENDPLQKRIIDSQESLTFLATLVNLLVVVAIEVLMLAVVLRQFGLAWPFLPALVTAYVAYRAAVQTAYAWSQDMRVLFDLHLDKAATALELIELPADAIDQRKQRWENVSRWLTYGLLRIEDVPYAQPERLPEWYRAIQPSTSASPQPHVVYPSSVSVQSRSSAEVERRDTAETPSRRVFGSVRDYLFVIVNQQKQPISNCYLLVDDTRLSALPTTISGRLAPIADPSAPLQASTITGRRCVGNVLLWLPGVIEARSGFLLEYSVRHDEIIVTVEPDHYTIASLSAVSDTDIQVSIQSSATTLEQLIVTVTTLDGKRPPEDEASFSIDGVEAPPVVAVGPDPHRPATWRWALQPKHAGTITFVFTRQTK